MEKLKKIIGQYGRWQPLEIYVQRIETHIESDFSLAIENSKALLESISKQICKEKKRELTGDESINKLVKFAFDVIGYEINSQINSISRALSSISHQIGNLRTAIGSTSHGRSLEELKERNSKVDELTREFLIDSTEIIASLLIRAFETENPRLKIELADTNLVYSENEGFNEFWDEAFGEFTMGDYSYTASEILFHVDYQAYVAEHKAFLEGEE
ncbi:MAG: abortive infection family protein [Candidatus Pacebacteria bacterium]|nr:abortive infection family protein [Candidatus Paceibacterota bacterium]